MDTLDNVFVRESGLGNPDAKSTMWGPHVHAPSSKHVMPNVAVEDLRWQPTEFEIRRIAARLVDKIIARRPDWKDSALALTDEAETKIKAMASDLKFDHEGNLIQGYFMSKDEFFGTMESNLREFEKAINYGVAGKSKARPAPMDWDRIRTPNQKRQRAKLAVG
jgi:hypothetical protein